MSSNLLPQVWPDKYTLSLKNLDGPHINKEGKTFVPSLGSPMSLHAALSTEHPSDAHLTQYAIQNQDGSTAPIPLIQKHVLRQIRVEGADLMLTCIGLDWDCPGHISLSPSLLTDFLEKFLTACELDERLNAWRSYYTTRHGCRVFYELKEPVKVDDGEQYIVSIIKEFRRHELDFDASCRDWSRRFRLPQVVRDGIHTNQEPMYDLQFQDVLLDVRQFKKADLKSLVVAREFVRKMSHPEQEECNAIIQSVGAQSKGKQSGYFKRARQTLNGCRYFDNIFNPKIPLCGDTGRNDFFVAMLGYIVPRLIEKCQATPEQIFALLHDPLCELELHASKQDPSEHCWNILQDFYENDYAKWLESQEKIAESVEQGQTAMGRMSKGMQQWCDAKELFDEDNAVVEAFVRGHLFANVGKFYYPLNEDGWYSNLCLIREQLIPRIRKSYLSDIVETEKQDMRGDPVSVSPVEVANKHSTIVQEIRMSPLQGALGRIDEIDGDKPILQLPMYQRNPYLKGEYSAAVDGWLKAVFGGHVVQVNNWLGYALDFEAGPICALSLSGAKGAGKKMLVEGLAECLVDPCSATGHDMCGGNNGSLLKTPFLFVNEGMPKARDMSPSDLFKQYTAGDAIRVRELYKPAIQVINPMRIILTANDHDLLHSLTRGKELTPDTKKAMGERILHFDINYDAENHLKRLGGRSYTEKEGARWIRGDSGQSTDFVVAKHFMYLYENRDPRDMSNRYCVMGNCDQSQSFQIASQSESLHPVMRGIIGLFQTPGGLKGHKKSNMSTGKAWVTKHGVWAYIREVNEERIEQRALEGVIKSLIRYAVPVDHEGMSFYELDTGQIVEYAKAWGIGCSVLRDIHGVWEENGGIL